MIARNEDSRISLLPRDGQITEQILAADLLRLVERVDLRELDKVDEDGDRAMLNAVMNEIINRVQELSNPVTERYLAHVESTQQLFTLLGGELPQSGAMR